MTDDELHSLFRLAESDLVERKESFHDKDKIRQAICAYANDLPNHRAAGVVFIGQRDDLSCAGLQVDDALLLAIANLRDDGKLLPFPSMTVRKVVLDGCTVAAILVQPSDNTPVRCDGRIWIRVGPRRGLASPEDERRLVEKRRWSTLPFDAQDVRGATLADLDLKRFQLEYLPVAASPEALTENNRPLDLQLRALRLLDDRGTPTATALLVIGTDPRRWFPGAYIQFLRVAGPNLTDELVDQKEISGPVGDQLRQMDELLRLNVRRTAEVGGALRGEVSDYPEEALRQLIRNAVLHRSYEGSHAPVRVTWFDDRVEIQSPGGPYGSVTRRTFGMPGVADYRNPTLAEALKALGFVERFGVGIAIARDRLAKNGNPPPEFVVEEAHVHVTVRKRP